MKKLLLFSTLLISTINFAQQGINYKAVISDNGIAVQNTAVTVYFTILKNGITNVYEESHSTTTDANGIVILNIGEGTVTSGVFSTIDWSLEYFLNVKVNAGSGITDMGTNAFKMVPYAKYALKSANSGATEIDGLSDGKSDNDGTEDGSSIFLGINAGLNDDQSDNQNVGIGFESLKANTTGYQNVANGSLALYSNTSGYRNVANGYQALNLNTTGHRNVANGTYSLKNNTTGYHNVANGYYSLHANTVGHENVVNGAYSLQANTTGYSNIASGVYSLNSNISGAYNVAIGFQSGKSSLGDRNIFLGYNSGYNETGSNKLYIENTDADPSNALIYGEFGVDNTTTGNILRTNSEFQIGDPSTTGYKFPTARGTADQVLKTDASGTLTWATNTTSGFVKINDLTDGKSDNDGTENGSSVFLGINAGLNDNQSDNKNVGIGFESLKANTNGWANMATGYQALYSNTTGVYNTASGYQALYYNTTSAYNTAIGFQSLYSSNGVNNTAIGFQSFLANTGSNNVGLGSSVFSLNTTGDYNTIIGASAGHDNITGGANIFLGYEAGYNETGSNKLYIENSRSTTPLIGGDFATDEVTINGALEVTQKLTAPDSGATDMKAYIYGSYSSTGTTTTNGAQSDGYTVSQIATGIYDVTFTTSPGNKLYTVITNMRYGDIGFISVINLDTKFTIKTYDTAGVAANKAFNFVVYKK